MSVIHVTLIRGYDAATQQRLSQRLTDAARAAPGMAPDAITVSVEVALQPGSKQDEPSGATGPEALSPAELALDFLNALESRDLARAQAMTAEGFAMTFPGNHVFHGFLELLDWAKPRYRRIAKAIERVEEVPLGDGFAVYISGTLHGQGPDGTPFAGIRFIDRFAIRGGLIVRQEVWNDMAESGAIR